MNVVAKAIAKIANPPRVSDPKRLHAAVSGKTVLVTGASYGLGEATARKLGAAGATVLLVARSADRLAALETSINAGGGRAAAYPADLTDGAAITALAKRLTENHGPMDIVVSNAGKSIRRSLHLQYDRSQDFERTIGVNYLGPIQLLLGLLPAMRRRGSGHIVSVSTIGVRTAPSPRWGAYLASKSAFDVWLRSVAPELSADCVHVTSVYMTLVHTRPPHPRRFCAGCRACLRSRPPTSSRRRSSNGPARWRRGGSGRPRSPRCWCPGRWHRDGINVSVLHRFP